MRQKNNPLGKIRYLWNCCTFFRQIYSIYRGFKPHMLRISLQKLMWFNRHNSLNFKLHFYKWTTVPSWIFSNNESKFAQLFVISSSVSVINVSCLLCIFKPSVQNVHQLQQHTIEVSFEMTGITGLPYQWTPVANRSISTAGQSSVRQCWTVLACISDSIPILRPAR